MTEPTAHPEPSPALNGFDLPGDRTDTGHRPERISFIITGAQKSGTTALSWFLAQHPDICMPSVKEVNFFVRTDRFKHDRREDYQDYHDLFVSYRPGQIDGEASPHYLPSPVFARRAHDYDPNLKLICILRNPIERAYSNYIMEVERAWEHQSFGQAIRAEWRRCLWHRFRRRPRSHRHAYVQRGRYARQVRRLLRRFRQDQILVLLTEDLMDDHVPTLQRVYDFLGVQRVDPPQPEKVFSADYDPMADDDRRYLQDLYRTDIAELSQIIGRDLSHWT